MLKTLANWFLWSKMLSLGAVAIAFLSLSASPAGAAIAQRGSPTRVVVTTSTLTLIKPTGVVSGDVMLASIANNGSITVPTAPAGWTLINSTTAGGTRLFGLWYKVAGGSEGANYAFTVGASGSKLGTIIAFSGADAAGGVQANGAAGGPFDVAAGSFGTGTLNTVPATSITTVSANAAVVMFGYAANDLTFSGWSTTSPGALTEIFDYLYNSASDSAIGAAWAIKVAAGATGAGAATLSGSTANAGILIALRPGISAANSTVTANPSTGVKADGIAVSTITVTVRDPSNNPMAGTTVTLLVSGTGNTVSTPAVTDVNGQTTATLKSTVAGIKTVTASVGVTTITQQPTVAFVDRQLAFTTQPANTVAGATMAAVVVQIQNLIGNPVAQSGTPIMLTLNGGALYSGTTPINTDVNGAATFNDLTIRQIGGGLTFTAAGGDMVSATSSVFAVTVAAASQVRVETLANGSGVVVPAQDLSVGQSVTNYAVSRDAFGNFVANVAVPVGGWSLANVTGGVSGGNLVASGDGKSAIFTASVVGSAKVRAFVSGLGSVDSGTLTVLPTPQMVQEFFLPMPEQQIWTALNAIGSSLGNNMVAVFSIIVTTPGTTVAYDEWEDGYETDMNSPSLATTKIWGDGDNANGICPGFANDPAGLPAGTIIALRNTVPVNSRVPANILYDGGDHVTATKAITISRAAWESTRGTVQSSAVEVLATLDHGTFFIAPIGTDVAAVAGSMFEYAAIMVMADADNTQVIIDRDGPGAVAPVTNTIARGYAGSYLTASILKGATVRSNKPIQVHMVTGDVGETYESRSFVLRPVALWSSQYIIPVCEVGAAPVTVFLFNTNSTALTVVYTNRTTNGTLTVPANNGILF